MNLECLGDSSLVLMKKLKLGMNSWAKIAGQFTEISSIFNVFNLAFVSFEVENWRGQISSFLVDTQGKA